MEGPTQRRSLGGSCHRVVGGGGALTGFSSGLGRKKALLALEDVAFPF